MVNVRRITYKYNSPMDPMGKKPSPHLNFVSYVWHLPKVSNWFTQHAIRDSMRDFLIPELEVPSNSSKQSLHHLRNVGLLQYTH